MHTMQKIVRGGVIFMSATQSVRHLNRCLHFHPKSTTRFLSTTTIPTFSKSNSTTPSSPPDVSPPQSQTKDSFDEFRAREEQKEQQFETQYAEETQKQQQQQQQTASSEEKVSSVQIKILEAALTHVPTLGWSKQALAKGAESLGYPGIAHGMFVRGGAELVDYFSSKCNKELIVFMEELRAQQEKNGAPDPAHKFVFKAIQYRVRMLEPYKSQWPQALAMMTMPPNVPTALSNVLTMVDDICYYGGDRSVDFNWYLRRLGLASIYKAAELFFLQDKSPDHEKTWIFLEHRISDATKVKDLLAAGLAQGGTVPQNIQQAGRTIFDTARNILGMNFNRR